MGNAWEILNPQITHIMNIPMHFPSHGKFNSHEYGNCMGFLVCFINWSNPMTWEKSVFSHTFPKSWETKFPWTWELVGFLVWLSKLIDSGVKGRVWVLKKYGLEFKMFKESRHVLVRWREIYWAKLKVAIEKCFVK